MKVILSHPFAGPLYWWFEQERQHPMSRDPHHPYYAALFGDVSRHIDVALACTLIYEEVVIPVADAIHPGLGELQDLSTSDIGIEVTSWEPISVAQKLSEPLRAGAWREDAILSQALADRSDSEVSLELHYAVADVLLAEEYGAPVLCSDGRREVIRRLLELGVVSGAGAGLTHFDSSATSAANMVEAYAEIAGLTFGVSGYRRFAELKWAPDLREYAASFQRSVSKPGVDTREKLYEAIATAMSSQELARRIEGAFEATSRVLDVAALVPIIGTPAGFASLGAQAGAAGAKRREMHARWYELSQAVAGAQVRLDLQERLRQRGLSS